MSNLTDNTAALEEILAAVNALPEAGGGEAADPVIEALNVTENGTYTAPDGVDGYSPVTVNVPVPDGYIQPNGTLNITENGEYDVSEKANVVVAVESGGSGGGSDAVRLTISGTRIKPIDYYSTDGVICTVDTANTSVDTYRGIVMSTRNLAISGDYILLQSAEASASQTNIYVVKTEGSTVSV